MVCYTCKKDKPLTEFALNPKRPKGRNNQCKECKRAYNRERYQARRAEVIRQVGDRRRELREKYQEYKRGRKCVRCGDDRWYVLDFHHRDGIEKEEVISYLPSKGWSWERMLKEIEKCDLLCANCHREVHFLEDMPV